MTIEKRVDDLERDVETIYNQEIPELAAELDKRIERLEERVAEAEDGGLVGPAPRRGGGASAALAFLGLFAAGAAMLALGRRS